MRENRKVVFNGGCSLTAERSAVARETRVRLPPSALFVCRSEEPRSEARRSAARANRTLVTGKRKPNISCIKSRSNIQLSEESCSNSESNIFLSKVRKLAARANRTFRDNFSWRITW